MKLNIYQKINAIQKQITSVQKDAEISMGGGRSYSAVSHDAVTNLLHMPLAQAGIVMVPSMIQSTITQTETKEVYNGNEKTKINYRADVTVSIGVVNADDKSDSFSVLSSAYSFDTGDKATGKAFSMAVKQAYLKLFMLESVDHEEERVEQGSSYQQKPIVQTKPAQSPLQSPQVKNHAPVVADKTEVTEAMLKRYWAIAKQLGWEKGDCETNILQQTNGAKKSPRDLSREEYTIITAKMQAATEGKNELF